MKGIILLLIIFTCFTSCNLCSKYNNEVYIDELDPEISNEDIDEWIQNMMTEWEEPNIKDLKREVYRLAIRSAFRQDTSFLIRAEEDSISGYLLTMKKLVGKESSSPRKVVEKKKRKISKKEWSTLLRSINESEFWMLPKVLPIDKGYVDVTALIFEGKRPQAALCNKREYHFVGRIVGNESDVSLFYNEILSLADEK